MDTPVMASNLVKWSLSGGHGRHHIVRPLVLVPEFKGFDTRSPRPHSSRCSPTFGLDDVSGNFLLERVEQTP